MSQNRTRDGQRHDNGLAPEFVVSHTLLDAVSPSGPLGDAA
ncbi:MAG: hypothetical protein ACRDQ5_27190 [Sciscionella sp.]